jgi:oligopeptide/dipeptide ABC transporter ATP-binding protein
VSRREAWERAVGALEQAALPDASLRARDYPHQLSGGLRQRAMIAMALVASPRLLVADEPTTALDVTIQAQILDLLRQLRDRLGLAVLLITHDLGVVAETCDRVAIMYAGRIVEAGATRDLLARPLHPYTRGLLASRSPETPAADPDGRLPTIPGSVPDLLRLPPGCAFAPRCPDRLDRCLAEAPASETVSTGRQVACHLHDEAGRGDGSVPEGAP